MDLHSGRVLLSDIEEYLQNGSLSQEKPYSFQSWSKLQREYVQSLDPKTTLPNSPNAVDFRYWGLKETENTYGDLLSTHWKLGKATTSKLAGPAQAAFKTEMPEMLVAAIVHSFANVFPDRVMPAVFTEGHGREPWTDDTDLSTTIGWFTTMFLLQIMPGDRFAETLKRVKDYYRSIPGKGLPYFSARYLKNDGSGLDFLESQEILFNYIGSFQQLERSDALLSRVPAHDFKVRDKSPSMHRPHVFEISATMEMGELHFKVEYPKNMQHQQAVTTWAAALKAVLQEASQVLPKMKPQPTINDFPLMNFTPKILNELGGVQFPALNIDWANVEDISPCSPMQHAILISQSKDERALSGQVHGRTSVQSRDH